MVPVGQTHPLTGLLSPQDCTGLGVLAKLQLPGCWGAVSRAGRGLCSVQGRLCSPLCDDQPPDDPLGAASPAHPAAQLQASGRAWGSGQAGQQREQDVVPGKQLEAELRAVGVESVPVPARTPFAPRGSSSRCRGSTAPCPSVPSSAAHSAGPAVPEPNHSLPRLCPCAAS